MPPGLRRLALSAHLALSVGWIGSVAAYVALDVTAVTSQEPQTLRAAYVGMGLIAGSVILPLALSALLTGVIMSVGTRWGLIRHWWVVISLLLTIAATGILMVEQRTIQALAATAVDPTTSSDELRSMGNTLVHSVGGVLVLLVVLVLNVYKPRGLTPYGWRRQLEERRVRRESGAEQKRA